MIDEYQNKACEQAYKSQYKIRVGAVVVYKNKIVGKGFNKVHSTGVPKLDGKHAELEALKNTTARYRENSMVFVCRITKCNDLAYSKPCLACQTVMRKMGVKYVWYSTEEGWTRMVL